MQELCILIIRKVNIAIVVQRITCFAFSYRIRHVYRDYIPIFHGDGQGFLAYEGHEAHQGPVAVFLILADRENLRVTENNFRDIVDRFVNSQCSEEVREKHRSSADQMILIFPIEEIDRIGQNKIREAFRLEREFCNILNTVFVHWAFQCQAGCDVLHLSIMDMVKSEVFACDVAVKGNRHFKAFLVLFCIYVFKRNVENSIFRIFACLRLYSLNRFISVNERSFRFRFCGQIQIANRADGDIVCSDFRLTVRNHPDLEYRAVLHGDDDLGFPVLQDTDFVVLVHDGDFFIAAGD